PNTAAGYSHCREWMAWTRWRSRLHFSQLGHIRKHDLARSRRVGSRHHPVKILVCHNNVPLPVRGRAGSLECRRGRLCRSKCSTLANGLEELCSVIGKARKLCGDGRICDGTCTSSSAAVADTSGTDTPSTSTTRSGGVDRCATWHSKGSGAGEAVAGT